MELTGGAANRTQSGDEKSQSPKEQAASGCSVRVERWVRTETPGRLLKPTSGLDNRRGDESGKGRDLWVRSDWLEGIMARSETTNAPTPRENKGTLPMPGDGLLGDVGGALTLAGERTTRCDEAAR